MSRPLMVVDFDGTITERDTLDEMVSRLAPGAYDRAEEGLRAGRISLHDCIRMEFESIRGEHERLVAGAVARTRVRPGFAELVTAARGAGRRVVVVSSGFEAVIRPVLEREGLASLEVLAHDVRFSPAGTQVSFRPGRICERCGEECKRVAVAELNGSGPGPAVYIGDGYSDRCAALVAHRVFARGGLAGYLDQQGVAYEPFEDFRTIRAALFG